MGRRVVENLSKLVSLTSLGRQIDKFWFVEDFLVIWQIFDKYLTSFMMTVNHIKMHETMILGWTSWLQPDKFLTNFGQVFDKMLTNYWQFFDEFQKEAEPLFEFKFKNGGSYGVLYQIETN